MFFCIHEERSFPKVDMKLFHHEKSMAFYSEILFILDNCWKNIYTSTLLSFYLGGTVMSISKLSFSKFWALTNSSTSSPNFQFIKANIIFVWMILQVIWVKLEFLVLHMVWHYIFPPTFQFWQVDFFIFLKNFWLFLGHIQRHSVVTCSTEFTNHSL